MAPQIGTIGPSALIVGILYVLTRWALSTVDYATHHLGKGRPDITWRVTWWIAILVSAGSAASMHVWILQGHAPPEEILVFNGIIFGGFLIGFVITGHADHKVRLGLRKSGG